jgi:hypothetical protein
MSLIDTPAVPSLNTAWLSGFTDAEGCLMLIYLNDLMLK